MRGLRLLMRRAMRLPPFQEGVAGIFAALLATFPLVAGAGIVDDVRRDAQRFASYPSRVVGSEGHDQALHDLQARLENLPNVRLWRHDFDVVVPRTTRDGERATLALEGDDTHRVHPLWPAGARLNTTPAEGITGDLTYIGEGRHAEIGTNLRGRIAVMEATGGRRWTRAFHAGAAAVILLGHERLAFDHLRSHRLTLSIHAPRFFVPDGVPAGQLRRTTRRGTLRAHGAWSNATATNLYALIAPLNDAPPQPSIAIAVTYDAMSLVPELAPGADAAIDTALALHLLRRFVDRPPSRPLLFCFIDAFGHNQVGIRQMLAALTVRPGDAGVADRVEAPAEATARDRLRRELSAALGLDPEDGLPLGFVLGIDLSDAGHAVGPMRYCGYQVWDEFNNARSFTRWLSGLDEDARRAIWPPPLARAVNLGPLSASDSPRSFNIGEFATLTSPAESFGTQAITWTTLAAPRRRVDTPSDSADRLDFDRLGPQIEATAAMVDALAQASGFVTPTGGAHRWTQLRGFVVDRAAGAATARVPMAGYLTTLIDGMWHDGQVGTMPLEPFRGLPRSPGMRREQFTFTADDGQFEFDFWPVRSRFKRYVPQSFSIAEDGRIVSAINLSGGDSDARLNVNVRTVNRTPLRAQVFPCRELALFELRDPRLLANLRVSLLDARRGQPFRRSNIFHWEGMLAAQMPLDARWQLVLRAGLVRNRLVLANFPDPGAATGRTATGQGFRIDDAMAAPSTEQAARDLYRLDGRRLEHYAAAGIHSHAIDALHARTGSLLEARHTDSGSSVDYQAPLSNEVRVYQAVRSTADDVVRGAVFLLIVLVPFSYAMERLLFASPRVHHQILAGAGIFLVMTALLWSFHPAFRITAQPLTVIMAFALVLMSGLVLSLIFSRFEGTLARAREQTGAVSAETSRLGVLNTAFRLGIAHMRKRRLRTALNGISIVLITFVLMCFVSTRKYAGDREYVVAASSHAAGAGTLIRPPAGRALPVEMLDHVQAMAERETSPVAVATRWWWVNPWDGQWTVIVRNHATGAQVSLKAALGLDPAEADVSDLPERLPDWERMGEGGGYLPAAVAEALDVEPGERIVIAGHDLELIGVFEPGPVDEAARDADGRSILPLAYWRMPREVRRMVMSADVRLQLEQSIAGETAAGASLPHLRSTDVAILSAGMVRTLSGATLRSIAISRQDGAAARRTAQALAERFAYPVSYHDEHGVRAVVIMPLLPRVPGRVLIPLAIGGLIIFNSMLSSITERRRDIYIYTSLGLAPLHVAFLFLAEAITYGLMGTIFGYVAGQGAATVLSRLGWLGGLTLNYSGSHAILVMLLVLAVVAVSALVPAFLAGRLAAPSHDRTWRLPSPVDDIIADKLPFSATDRTAPGLLRFVAEYFESHRERTIGNFATDQVVSGASEVQCTVWLSPYDLGVRQEIRITAAPAKEPGVVSFFFELRRQSGQVPAWHKLNRFFVGRLRRQMLGWRQLSPEKVTEYVEAVKESEGRKVGTSARQGTAHG